MENKNFKDKMEKLFSNMWFICAVKSVVYVTMSVLMVLVLFKTFGW